jgi:hypothetical protein
LAHKGGGQAETLPERLPQMSRHRRTGRAARLPGYACGPWSARLSPARESAPSGEPRGRRGGDAGRSEGHPVRGWRGVEHAPPHSTRQRADCPCGSGLTSDHGAPLPETKQMPAVATPAGALSRHAVDGPAIKGPKAHTLVRRLPGRLVQATQAGRGGKVRALQRLGPHACAAKVVAGKRVTANPGTRTPGVAGVLWETPAQQAQAVGPRRHHGSRPHALRRVASATSGGPGQRPRSRPWRHARALQALSVLALEPLAAPPAAPHSSGCRLARSTAAAMEPGPLVLALRHSAPWRLAGDIRSCCESFAHDWLRAHIPMAHAILRQWFNAGLMDQQGLSPTAAGVPPGGVASPVSRPLALHG